MSPRQAVRTMVPATLRSFIRRLHRETPHRLRDLLPDLVDRYRPEISPLPPASLRAAVGLTSSRREFLDTGRAAAQSIDAAFDRVCGGSPAAYPRWLDFGCGAGRVSRHLMKREHQLWGIDTNSTAIRWAQTHLQPAIFLPIEPSGPAPFPAAFFDVVVAVSVFTHFAEPTQDIWLRELCRILRPGGLLFASTHSPTLTFTRPDLTPGQRASLSARGFLFAPGGGAFNEDSTFHSRLYLERSWGALFLLRDFCECGLAGYQDLSVWERAGIDPAGSSMPAPSSSRCASA
jgi:SAM-dependent methyltransferase